MAGWVKVPAAKPNDLGLIPKPTWWEEETELCELPFDLTCGCLLISK